MIVDKTVSAKGAPFFSIITPVYNTNPQYFADCMDSLLKQSCPDFEILIIDDGSAAEYADVYDEIAAKDSRIQVFHDKNQGVSAARNKGIQLAKADWILFVDGDDWLELDAIEKLKHEVSTVDCDILLFNYRREFKNGNSEERKTGFQNRTLYNAELPENKEFLYRRAMGTPNLDGKHYSTIYYSWDKVYKRSFLTSNDLTFPEGLPKSEDKVFILRCFEKMRSFYYFDAMLYHYRINESSASNRYSPDVDEERKRLLSLLEDIALRMDKELAELKKTNHYCLVHKEYVRFAFGIISDIMFSKYYHKDYPYSGKQRRKKVSDLLAAEPFYSAVRMCKYSDLDKQARVKKFMLSHGMADIFFSIRKKMKKS